MKQSTVNFWIVVAGVAAVILVIFVVRDHYLNSAPGPGTQVLTANIEYGPVLLTPDMQSRIEALQKIRAIDWDERIATVTGWPTRLNNMQPRPGKPSLTPDQVELAGAIVRSTLQPLIPAEVTLPFDVSGGYYRVRVRNDGSQALSAVRLSIPGASSIEVRRENQKQFTTNIGSVLVLDDLHPQECVEVRAFAPTEPSSLFDEPRIALSHAAGVGKIKFAGPATCTEPEMPSH
jgi:hypothetical protein